MNPAEMPEFDSKPDFSIRRTGTLCQILGLAAVAGALLLPGCAGEVLEGEDSGGDGDATQGDGDGRSGDGDGDGDGEGGQWGGDGDIIGDGDGDIHLCTLDYRYGLTATVYGVAEGSADSFGAAPPLEPEILPPEDPIQPPPLGGAPGVDEGCAVRVLAVDGSYQEELTCVPDPSGGSVCNCYGAGERPGTYSVTAYYNNVTETHSAILGSDGCHVDQVQLYFGIVR